MLLVVADTSPIRYLVQIDQIELLARLFQKILIPSIVADELRHPSAPAAVRAWIKAPPAWLDVVTAPESNDPALNTLDPGEKAALALGASQRADLILIDERKAAAVALKKGFETTGTLGVLDLAARRGLIDLKTVLDRLKGTNFRYRQAILDALLRQQEGEQR
jgi:predicted nucleic acid-binding protein